jgi:nitrate reductase assembly molybdenum cofactor insertion protein NarJ
VVGSSLKQTLSKGEIVNIFTLILCFPSREAQPDLETLFRVTGDPLFQTDKKLLEVVQDLEGQKPEPGNATKPHAFARYLNSWAELSWGQPGSYLAKILSLYHNANTELEIQGQASKVLELAEKLPKSYWVVRVADNLTQYGRKLCFGKCGENYCPVFDVEELKELLIPAQEFSFNKEHPHVCPK